MKYQLSIGGHAWNRCFLLKKPAKGDTPQALEQYHSPGGAALIHQVCTQREETAVAPLGSMKGYQCQYLTLANAAGKKEEPKYLVESGYGWTSGKNVWQPEAGSAWTLVLDEGLGGLEALPNASGRLFWASSSALPPAQTPLVKGVVLMLDINVLRKNGALISRQISWERTTMELMWQLSHNPRFAYLKKAENLLIAFGCDAVVHVFQEKGKTRARLVLGHGASEGLSQEKQNGDMPDVFWAMVAWLATGLVQGKPDWAEACSGMLAAGGYLQNGGYSVAALADERWFSLPEPSGRSTVAFDIPTSSKEHVADPEYWCITGTYNRNRLYQQAVSIVENGLSAIDGLPHLQFGNLTTVDRREIESFQNARNLIMDYMKGKASKPLSIAVFGSPGSGKSFGVTQIAKNIAPDQIVKLEFNVSQFRGPEDLCAAFHTVRDTVLKGKLPLVFFDEFDSDNEGRPLGWLKSFLMPMQDGEFRDENGQHPIGRCIMVFAGGTSTTFEAFSRPVTSDAPEGERAAFRAVKGPDFVSRLRGSINIMGPNPVDGQDQNYLLRRAILLRSFSERKLDVSRPGFIDPDILRTMLVIPRYKHGARSMEAIFDMSRLQGNALRPVSLPFHTQLSLHVDADAFIKLVLRDTILGSYNETLAKAIHVDFCKKNPAHAQSMKWEKLSEEIRNSNRRQAATYPEKLAAIGMSFDGGESPFATVESFTKEEAETLARIEHDLWVQEKKANGWKYTSGPKDEKKKLTPYLAAWDKIPKEIQQYDYDTVDNMIPMLQSVGLRVYRTV